MTLLCELGKIKAITQQIFYCYLVRSDDTLQMTVFILEASNLGETLCNGQRLSNGKIQGMCSMFVNFHTFCVWNFSPGNVSLQEKNVEE